jgi:hypothetical protein
VWIWFLYLIHTPPFIEILKGGVLGLMISLCSLKFSMGLFSFHACFLRDVFSTLIPIGALPHAPSKIQKSTQSLD